MRREAHRTILHSLSGSSLTECDLFDWIRLSPYFPGMNAREFITAFDEIKAEMLVTAHPKKKCRVHDHDCTRWELNEVGRQVVADLLTERQRTLRFSIH